ncbi:basic proline-rich protein-like [Mustela lutreola]|uniref:basic proline-rich protein-like n=1 Tax=Mustela lutreola TaxID=9666 RepID=UPI002797393A|nr:basic proline-rich protein-like [Mustela lutreola]
MRFCAHLRGLRLLRARTQGRSDRPRRDRGAARSRRCSPRRANVGRAVLCWDARPALRGLSGRARGGGTASRAVGTAGPLSPGPVPGPAPSPPGPQPRPPPPAPPPPPPRLPGQRGPGQCHGSLRRTLRRRVFSASAAEHAPQQHGRCRRDRAGLRRHVRFSGDEPRAQPGRSHGRCPGWPPPPAPVTAAGLPGRDPPSSASCR